MFLMNIPPVIATHTEWRTCGPEGGYSLPLCLNDSDSDQSTRGTPISDKVQMIIDSLRSTQSSVEMGDETEKKTVPGHAHVCNIAVGSKTKSPSKVNLSSAISHDESDSDDSVDRGIEEAILEYLKEKDGPKRKSETCSNPLQLPKIPRITSPVPGISKLNSESNMFLTSNEFPKSEKMEKPLTPALYPLKKYIKHKTLINDSAFTKQEALINPSRLTELPSGQTNKPLSDLTNPEEDSDSSSDDGIEEAIQKYQMEKDQQSKKRSVNLHEDSESTSDDGIEEAIRRYQLEQLQEESAVKAFLNKSKQKTVGKALRKANPATLKKKKSKVKKEVLFLDVSRGNGLHSFKVEGFRSQSAAPKANTTAELMCAEAILDISKTVMPRAFPQTLGSSTAAQAEAESGDSSVDSEDGIEQEIKRFLEQKAQMHKQTASEPGAPSTDKARGREERRAGKLSLTKRRKQKNKNLSLCAASKTSPESATLPTLKSKSQKTEESGDKSSSLDSDEDLDTAIKDLLKTKKRVKKKTLKPKPPKGLKKEELQGSALVSRKTKPEASVPEQTTERQTQNQGELSFSKLIKHSSQQKQLSSGKGPQTDSSSSKVAQDASSQLKAPAAPQREDEGSSVDSDDSIELEIRRFLAEKAKGATAEQNKDMTSASNGIRPIKTVEREIQLAEIPQRSAPVFGQMENKPSQPSPRGLSQSVVEPAATRTQSPERGSVSKEGAPSPSIAPSQSASIKWRQSLGLPITDTKVRTPFLVNSSRSSDAASGTRLQSSAGFKLQTPASVWSKINAASPFPRSPEAAAGNAAHPPHVLSFLSPAKAHPGPPFARRLAPGQSSQYPNEEETKSMVHIPKDKSVYVQLETNRTNHVQVRDRGRSQDKEGPEGEGARERPGEADRRSEIKEESYVDECESGNESSPEKEQGLSTLSLSSAIDPGFTFRPYIALTTEERRQRFGPSASHSQGWARSRVTLEQLKRKLQFVPLRSDMNLTV